MPFEGTRPLSRLSAGQLGTPCPALGIFSHVDMAKIGLAEAEQAQKPKGEKKPKFTEEHKADGFT